MEKEKEFLKLFLGLSPKSQDYLINMCQLALIEKNSNPQELNKDNKGLYEQQR